MNEIFDRRRRFIVVDHASLEFDPFLVLMTDIGWWADNIDSVQAWCDEHMPGGYEFSGMTLHIDREQDLSMFLLRWSD